MTVSESRAQSCPHIRHRRPVRRLRGPCHIGKRVYAMAQGLLSAVRAMGSVPPRTRWSVFCVPVACGMTLRVGQAARLRRIRFAAEDNAKASSGAESLRFIGPMKAVVTLHGVNCQGRSAPGVHLLVQSWVIRLPGVLDRRDQPLHDWPYIIYTANAQRRSGHRHGAMPTQGGIHGNDRSHGGRTSMCRRPKT
jgi:hypothetical protein